LRRLFGLKALQNKDHRHGDGFVSYTELTKADTRKLAQEIGALAEELSQVPAQIVD
jgi:iron uptake system EfeUOB component EfeO/EfeM